MVMMDDYGVCLWNYDLTMGGKAKGENGIANGNE